MNEEKPSATPPPRLQKSKKKKKKGKGNNASETIVANKIASLTSDPVTVESVKTDRDVELVLNPDKKMETTKAFKDKSRNSALEPAGVRPAQSKPRSPSALERNISEKTIETDLAVQKAKMKSESNAIDESDTSTVLPSKKKNKNNGVSNETKTELLPAKPKRKKNSKTELKSTCISLNSDDVKSTITSQSSQAPSCNEISKPKKKFKNGGKSTASKKSSNKKSLTQAKVCNNKQPKSKNSTISNLSSPLMPKPSKDGRNSPFSNKCAPLKTSEQSKDPLAEKQNVTSSQGKSHSKTSESKSKNVSSSTNIATKQMSCAPSTMSGKKSKTDKSAAANEKSKSGATSTVLGNCYSKDKTGKSKPQSSEAPSSENFKPKTEKNGSIAEISNSKMAMNFKDKTARDGNEQKSTDAKKSGTRVEMDKSSSRSKGDSLIYAKAHSEEQINKEKKPKSVVSDIPNAKWQTEASQTDYQGQKIKEILREPKSRKKKGKSRSKTSKSETWTIKTKSTAKTSKNNISKDSAVASSLEKPSGKVPSCSCCEPASPEHSTRATVTTPPSTPPGSTIIKVTPSTRSGNKKMKCGDGKEKTKIRVQVTGGNSKNGVQPFSMCLDL